MLRKHRKSFTIALTLGVMMFLMVSASFAQSIDTAGIQSAAVDGVNTLFDSFADFLPLAMVVLGIGAGLMLAFAFGDKIINSLLRAFK